MNTALRCSDIGKSNKGNPKFENPKANRRGNLRLDNPSSKSTKPRFGKLRGGRNPNNSILNPG